MKNVVYIIGAGASKDFGLPLGKEIFKRAYELSQSCNTNITALGIDKLIDEVENNLHFIFSGLPINKDDFPPFEEILTFIWDLKQKEIFDYKQNKYSSIFKTNIQDVFDTFVNFYAATFLGSLHLNTKTNDNLKLLELFIKSLDYKNENISFISFNYDTIFDDILSECVNEKIIEEYTYGIPLYNINDNCDRFNPHSRTLLPFTGTHLLKPHGSLNLSYCSHKQASYGDGYFYDKEYLKNWNNLKCPCCGGQAKHLFIPPLYNKKDFIESTAIKKPFNFRSTPEKYRIYIDGKITECIINADEIITIGYSMPSYDFDFKSLLLTSLMQNKKRDKVALRIITNSEKCIIPQQFQNLVGDVSIIAYNGFLEYLKSNNKTAANIGM